MNYRQLPRLQRPKAVNSQTATKGPHLAQFAATPYKERAPTELMEGTTFEVDELYQHAGKSDTHCDPNDPPLKRCFTRKTPALS
jgi:hypothetical protein